MKADLEKQLRDRMSQASAGDLIPGFHKEDEWAQLQKRLQHGKKRLQREVWLKAAVIVVFIGIMGLVISDATNTGPLATLFRNSVRSGGKQPPLRHDSVVVQGKTGQGNNSSVPGITMKEPTRGQRPARKAADGEIIHNSTPCPIEICISQTVSCPDKQPAAIASRSTLEPDESARLNYKDHDDIGKNCSLTIREIEIKSVATGETILLNSSSKPSTAQEVFSYMTLEKRGDILAGAFNADCNNRIRHHNLRIDNRYDSLIIQ